jgi:hypothetical protein
MQIRKSIFHAVVFGFITSLAIGSITTSAHAATGQKFGPKDENLPELIVATHNSLLRDPTGHAKLLPRDCAIDRNSCATPYDYFVSFQKLDPEAGLTDISQLEDYLSILVVGKTPTDGEYRMACLVPTGAPGMYTPDVDCSHRAFTKGEIVWYDPHTKRIVLAGDCKNPVGAKWDVIVPAPPPCKYVNADTRSTADLHEILSIHAGVQLDDSKCPVGIKLPGDADFHPFCPDLHCQAIQYQVYTGMVAVRSGSEKLPNGGRVVIRLPIEDDEVDLCLRQEGDPQTPANQSCGQRIHAPNYRFTHDNTTPNGPPVLNAYVLYPGDKNETGVPVVYWHWSAEYKCWVF